MNEENSEETGRETHRILLFTQYNTL